MVSEVAVHSDSSAVAGGHAPSLGADLLSAGSVLAGFLLAALMVRLLWARLLRPLAQRSTTDLDDRLLPPVRTLVLWGLALMGVYQAANSLAVLQSHPQAARLVDRGVAMAAVALVLSVSLRVFNLSVSWYLEREPGAPPGGGDIAHAMGLVRKVGNVLLCIFGGLYLLRTAGADITPLLAGGAIGGLAVALAMQDTLSNLFAGFFMTIGRPVKAGDYIRLESGEEGFVDEIGWRNTKIRLLANNLVIIPNAKLSQSTIVNHFLPEPAVNVYVGCGVAYDSDLQHVEAVTTAVGREVLQRIAGADAGWEPVVRWQEFGDSAVTFVTVLRATDFSAQYPLRSEFVKALHQRFRAQGIEIPYPVRTVVIKGAAPRAAIVDRANTHETP